MWKETHKHARRKDLHGYYVPRLLGDDVSHQKGFGAAKPYGDCESYDFILDPREGSAAHLWRVQVSDPQGEVLTSRQGGESLALSTSLPEMLGSLCDTNLYQSLSTLTWFGSIVYVPGST
jgi:hypothetical protein